MHPQVKQTILHSKNYIDSHLDGPLNGEEIARQAFLSYFHFQHQFRQYTGESLWQYIKRLRLEKAAFLLAFTSIPVADVAIQCGFEATASLSKAFRRQRSLSPQQYRTRAQQGREKPLPAIDWNEVKTQRLSPTAIISFRSEGLGRIPEGYFRWMERLQSLPASPSALIGKSPDQPGVTAGEKIRWDTSMPAHLLPEQLRQDLREWIVEESLPGGNYLVMPFQGFGTSFTSHLPSLLARLRQEGIEFRPSGRPFQVLQEHAPDSRCFTNVYIPVR